MKTPGIQMHPIKLRFQEPVLEEAFVCQSLPRLRLQGRIALATGIFVYMLFGVLDQWYVPPETQATIWTIRFVVIGFAFSVLLFTYHHRFDRYNFGPLVLAGSAAGAGMLAILWELPTNAIAYYYSGLVLTAFWTYNFVGTRFVYALIADITLLVSYNIMFGLVRDLPTAILASHDYVLISSNLIGGAAGYMAERYRRTLFLRELELDNERKHHQQRALHDPLTGLPNRDLLDDRIMQAISLALRENQPCVGLFIDLDNFKTINDTLGHDAGDRVLCETAVRLRQALRDTDTISRIAGDEFFVVVHGIATRQEAEDLAQKILHELEQPLVMAEAPAPLILNASLGMCLFPYPDCTPSDIIRRADQAMYHSKRTGKHRASFSE